MEVITTHVNADFDGLASMLAAKKLYPEAVLAFPGSQEKSLRNFLLRSTAYVFQFEPIRKIDLSEITRLVLVDIREASRIGRFAEIVATGETDIHIYDHHPSTPDDIRGSVEIIKPVGATTTIFCQIFEERNIALTADEATILMLGIHEDTGSLTFSSTTSDDYQAAAYLLAQGANLNIVSDMINPELTAEQVSLLNELIQTATGYYFDGTEVIIATASHDHFVGDFAVLVHKLKDMKNIDALFALARMESRVYLVGRSRIENVNVGEIALEFGGGGHASASSAAIRDMTLVQAKEKLVDVLSERIRRPKRVKDIMSYPVKSVESGKTLEVARKLMNLYNINVLPVTRGGRLNGLISRQTIEKAFHHGLREVSIEEYMTTEFTVAHPDMTWAEAQKPLVAARQRLLPVVEEGQLVGVLTRTDFLRTLHAHMEPEPQPLFQARDTLHSVSSRRLTVLMEERLAANIRELLRSIGKIADDMGVHAYAVGGFVRDLFLRRDNLDIDVVVEGDGIKAARRLAALHSRRAKAHRSFGTATVAFENGLKVDMASARREYYEHPAAVPKVEEGSIKLDLYRRDFSINTLAIKLNPSSFGELIDSFGGRRDLKERTIRVLHNLSFVEDPTRIFRAIRFEQRFGFHIGPLTKRLIENAVRMKFLERLGGHRILTELILVFQEDKVASLIKRLDDFALLSIIQERIRYDRALESLVQSAEGTLSWYDLLFLEDTYERWVVFFLVLVHCLSTEEAEEVCNRLSMTQKQKRRVLSARVKTEAALSGFFKKRALKRSQIYRLLGDLSTEALLYMMAKTDNQAVKKAVSLYFTQLRGTKICLRGDDLKELGLKPGRIYTRILDDVLNETLNRKVHSKMDEIEFVKEKYL